MAGKGHGGCATVLARRGIRALLAGVALAIGYALLMGLSLQPTPAVAQFGGFGNIHIYFGGGHWRGGRHSHGRHSRHHRNKDEDNEKPQEATTPSSPALPPSATGGPATTPSTVAGPSAPPGPTASRPEPRGPILEPSK